VKNGGFNRDLNIDFRLAMGLNASDLAAISKKSDAEENHPVYQIIQTRQS